MTDPSRATRNGYRFHPPPISGSHVCNGPLWVRRAIPGKHREGGQTRPQDADAVEIDVRRCGSGEIVVIHYDHVAPITDGHGDVDELSAADLNALSVDGSGEGVPRLETVLDVIPPSTDINIELKETYLAADVLDAINGIDNDVVISALNANIHTLWETRLLDESVPLACNFSMRPKEDLEVADLIGCTHANPHWWMCLGTDIVDRAHDHGIEVHAWPVGSPIIAEALRWRGVDGLIARTPQDARPMGENISFAEIIDRIPYVG